MAELVIEVTNTKDVTVVVGTKIIQRNETAKVRFTSGKQLLDALAAERHGLLRIVTPISEEDKASLGIEPTAAMAAMAMSVEVTPPEESVEPSLPTIEDVQNDLGIIDSMRVAEIKEFVKKNNLDVPGYNSMVAAELKPAVKEAVQALVDGEKATE